MSVSKEPPLDQRKICPDCKEVYKDPRLLRCLHPLCAQSIRDMLKDAQDKNTTPKCPICGDEAGIIDLAELPPLGLVDTEQSDEDVCIIQGCMMCDEPGAQHCKTCNNIYFCTAHAAEHMKAKRNATHQMATTVPRHRAIYECRLHERQEFVKFCMTCMAPVCDGCLKTGKHRAHTLLHFDKAFEELRDSVGNYPDVIRYFEQFEKLVTDIFSDMINKLQQRRDEVLNEGRGRLLEGLPDNMTFEVLHEQMTNVHQWDEMGRQKPDEPLILLHIHNFIMRRLDVLSKKRSDDDDESDVETFTFAVNKDMQQMFLHSLQVENLGAIVSVHKRRRLNTSAETVDWTRTLRQVLNVPLPGKYPHGVAVLGGDMLVVSAYGSHELLFVSAVNGEIVNTIGRHGNGNGEFDNPCGVAVDKERNIWVVDQGNSRVQCFTEHGVFVRSFHTAENFFSNGIAVLDNGTLAVSHDTNDSDVEPCVTIYTPHGDVVLNILWTLSGEFRDVKCKNNELYVTASEQGQVLVFSATTGELIRSFGRDKEEDEERDDVFYNGLALTPDGHVLVSEGAPTHCVSVWSQAGERLHHWGGDKFFEYPYHLTIMPNGQVVVINSSVDNLQILS